MVSHLVVSPELILKMSGFEIISQKLPDWVVDDDPQDIMLVHIKGALDFNTTPKLHKVLDDCLSQQVYRLVVDLKQVTYLSSTGLGAFISLRRRLEEHHGHVVFMHPSPEVKTVFGLFEFDPFATITDNMKTALDELQVKKEE